MRRRALWMMVAAVALLGFAAPASAWWNGEWQNRRSVEIDASPLQLLEPVAAINVPIRLHTGNFTFEDAADDGADLRFIAGDDATPLPFYVERYDRENEIALIWVRIFGIGGGAAKQKIWIYYGNPEAEPGSFSAGIYEVTTVAAFHFSAAEALPQDATAFANSAVRSTVAITPGGVIGDAARLVPQSSMQLPRVPSLDVPTGGSLTFSAWLRLGARAGGLVFSHRTEDRGIALAVDAGALYARIDSGGGVFSETPRSEPLDLDRWHHVAMTADPTALVVYVDGLEVARAAAALPPLAGTVELGASGELGAFTGELDQVELASTARAAPAIALAAALEAPDTAFVRYAEVAEVTRRGYVAVVRIIGVSVSPEGWVIVGIILVLGVISMEVLLRKQRLLRRIKRADRTFLQNFDDLSLETLARRDAAAFEALGHHAEHSALNRVFRAGLSELDKVAGLLESKGRPLRFTPEVVEVLRSGIDGEIVRQSARMNNEMVTLTLAVSAAPFLGLLGTVVGIMMTFGAVALVGDIDVSTIAPGVAAALITTVAGLAVAIPAMFGYNRLTTTIRDLTTGMETFANELLARLTMANVE